MSSLAAVETLRERRLTRNRRNAGLGFRYGADGFVSEAELAAERLAQREADEALVAQELAKEDEEAKRFAIEAEAAPARLKKAAEEYVRVRRPVEIALAGGKINGTVKAEPSQEAQRIPFSVEVIGLLEALEALVPARRAYEEAFAICDKYGVLGDHHRVEHLAVAPHLHKLMNLAAQA